MSFWYNYTSHREIIEIRWVSEPFRGEWGWSVSVYGCKVPTQISSYRLFFRFCGMSFAKYRKIKRLGKNLIYKVYNEFAH